MKKLSKTPLVAAIAVTVSAGVVNAQENPFAMTELAQGYQLAKAVPFEGSTPPAAAKKEGEMACGASMNMDKDAGVAKKADAACGEKKCGAMMDGDKMKPGMENACGAMMKGKEGACGAMGDTKATPAPAAGQKSSSEMACGAAMMKAAGMKDKDIEAACGGKMSPTK